MFIKAKIDVVTFELGLKGKKKKKSSVGIREEWFIY